MKARGGRRETTAKVLKDRRSPRRRGRMGTSVNMNAPPRAPPFHERPQPSRAGVPPQRRARRRPHRAVRELQLHAEHLHHPLVLPADRAARGHEDAHELVLVQRPQGRSVRAMISGWS
eukprot:30771-Pelagococcus_subviridis.AAC.2